MYRPVALCPRRTYTFNGFFYATFNYACTLSVVALGEALLMTVSWQLKPGRSYTETLSFPIADELRQQSFYIRC
jgi:hypothetical protein